MIFQVSPKDTPGIYDTIGAEMAAFANQTMRLIAGRLKAKKPEVICISGTSTADELHFFADCPGKGVVRRYLIGPITGPDDRKKALDAGTRIVGETFPV